MNLNPIKPRKALNKAKPNRGQVESFKANLIELFDTINESESEEFHKNFLSKFPEKTYSQPAFKLVFRKQ